MALVTATAAAAGTAAAAMYLDAKLHITKDVHRIRGARQAAARYKKAVRENRQCLYYRFEEVAKRLGDQECIWSREGCYTWTQTLERINQFGQWFLSQGVKPRDLVAFYMQNSPDFVFAWLGLWSIGAGPAMINSNLADKALIHCLKISEATLLIVDEAPELLARAQGVASTIENELGLKMVVLDNALRTSLYRSDSSRPDEKYRVVVQGDWPMGLFYTSGTTGLPKASLFTVSRQHLAIILNSAGAGYLLPTDRWYNCMPMYHGTGGISAVSRLLEGIPLCIGKKFSTSKFWSDIRDSRATWFVYVGETARYLLAAPPSPRDKDHCVRGMYGNGLRPDVWEKFRNRFGIPEVLEFFSSTEGVFNLAVSCKNDFLVGSVGLHGALARALMKNKYVPVEIDQETGAIVRDPKTGFAKRQPFSTGGEMIVNVPNEGAFVGYYNNPEATSKKFERDVFKKGDLWYRSGDALRRTDDGRWYFLDRLGDTFRWKGENVSTAEVAEVLGKFPGVVEANVYGVRLPNHDGRAGCAALYIDPGARATFDFRGLLKYARTSLPRYAVPIFIRLVKEMTPIHNNKQNKVPLREEGVDPAKVKSGDTVLYVVGDTYEPFTAASWENINAGVSRL